MPFTSYMEKYENLTSGFLCHGMNKTAGSHIKFSFQVNTINIKSTINTKDSKNKQIIKPQGTITHHTTGQGQSYPSAGL